MKLPARYMFTAATIACIAFLLAASVTVYFWLSAVWGVVIYCVTMAPILGYAALGGFFFDPTKAKDGLVDEDAPRLRNRILGMTIPIVTASVPFLALLVAWHTPTARAAMAATGGGLGVRPIAERALGDFDPMVAHAGCKAITELGSEKSRDLVVSRLFASEDEELVRCLLLALPSDISSESGMRLQMLAAKWDRQLWQEGLEPERACTLADHLRHAERAGVDLASPRLLSCAVGAPETSSRQCCAQSLRGAMGGAKSVAAILPTPERASAVTGIVGRTDLIVTSPRRADAEVVAILGLDEPEYEAWSLSMGCEALKIWRNDVRRKAGTAMARRLNETCSIDAPVEENFAVWAQACSAAATSTADPSQLDEAICDGLHNRFSQEAIAMARRDVFKAARLAATPRRKLGILETMMGMGMVPNKSFDFGQGGGGLPSFGGGLSGFSGIDGMPNNLDVLSNPAFDQLNKMPAFKQMLQEVESRQQAPGTIDPEMFRQALERQNLKQQTD